MTMLSWPLERNEIRGMSRSNAYGMVRNGGKRAHQGWDLIAIPGTPCFAVADGKVMFADYSGDYGNLLVIKFEHRGRTLYAAYAHLSSFRILKGLPVERGMIVARTGNTGNAKTMTGADQHLHFEIRTTEEPGSGLSGRIDPARIYGATPLYGVVIDGHGMKVARRSAHGLRVPGINVLE